MKPNYPGRRPIYVGLRYWTALYRCQSVVMVQTVYTLWSSDYWVWKCSRAQM